MALQREHPMHSVDPRGVAPKAPQRGHLAPTQRYRAARCRPHPQRPQAAAFRSADKMKIQTASRHRKMGKVSWPAHPMVAPRAAIRSFCRTSSQARWPYHRKRKPASPLPLGKGVDPWAYRTPGKSASRRDFLCRNYYMLASCSLDGGLNDGKALGNGTLRFRGRECECGLTR